MLAIGPQDGQAPLEGAVKNPDQHLSNLPILKGQERQLLPLKRNENTTDFPIAHHLQALGVGPGVLVGICMEHSLKMIVGLLGVLKAGGAYVPLDPLYPPERLAFMIQDNRITVLLTQERLREWMPEPPARVVSLDADWEAIVQESTANSTSGITAENLAYVIYTSGSTGRPKGGLIAHLALVNESLAFKEYFDLWPDGGYHHLNHL